MSNSEALNAIPTLRCGQQYEKVMREKWYVRLTQRTPCALPADCIRLTGSFVSSRIRIIDYSKAGMGLVSRKAMEVGSYQIIRVYDLDADENLHDCRDIRMVGVAEVQWIKKIDGDDGTEFRAGVKYLFVP